MFFINAKLLEINVPLMTTTPPAVESELTSLVPWMMISLAIIPSLAHEYTPWILLSRWNLYNVQTQRRRFPDLYQLRPAIFPRSGLNPYPQSRTPQLQSSGHFTASSREDHLSKGLRDLSLDSRPIDFGIGRNVSKNNPLVNNLGSGYPSGNQQYFSFLTIIDLRRPSPQAFDEYDAYQDIDYNSPSSQVNINGPNLTMTVVHRLSTIIPLLYLRVHTSPLPRQSINNHTFITAIP